MVQSALLTDAYELSMLQGYFANGMREIAVFEFFVRRLPDSRNFLIAAGLEQVLEFLETLRLTEDEMDWLRSTGRYLPEFLDFLRGISFTGDVDAMPEGTAFFADEPVLRISAPIAEAQLIETRLMNLLQFQIIVASKAARCALAAPDRLLVDFGVRRAHGYEAGLLSARASYLAGFSGTSTLLAGMSYGIPVFGTMAHSYVQAFETEEQAFESFAEVHTGPVILLIDTYDTEEAARKVTRLAQALRDRGIRIAGVRIDSGDLGEHARKVRRILDQGDLRDAMIFASGGLDELALRKLVRTGAPIGGFGVGTRMNTSADAPYLDCAYKLQEYAGLPRRKRSEGKATWPGRKQVYRFRDAQGLCAYDVLTTEGDPMEGGEPLLIPFMRGGRRIAPSPSLDSLRERCRTELSALPSLLLSLDPAHPGYSVRISPRLLALTREMETAQVTRRYTKRYGLPF